MKNIILKSSSPRRFELLSKYTKDFTVKVYDVDEKMDNNLTPYENVKNLGLKKASINKEEEYGSILIGCDTIVVLDNKIYGKPKDEVDAKKMLMTFSGNTHEVLSGVGIIYKDHVYNFVSKSTVTFKELTEKEIDDYIKTKECFGKAGGYAIQGFGRALVSNYSGSIDNIIGLPTEEVFKILGEINEMED